MNFIKAFVESLDEETFAELYTAVSVRHTRTQDREAQIIFENLNDAERSIIREYDKIDAIRWLRKENNMPLYMAHKIVRLVHGDRP